MPSASSYGTVQGAQPVEYVEETSFGATPSDPAMQWIGAVNSWAVTDSVESQTVRYLPGEGTSNKLETLQNVKVSEMVSVEGTYFPQDLSFLQYWLGGNGSLSDDLTSISVGEIDEDNTEYRVITGLVGEEMTLTIEEDSVAEVEFTMLGADAGDWNATDYIDAGSHATADTTTPLSYDDLGSVQLGGSALGDAIESLALTVSNDLTVVKDPDSSLDSHIVAIVPTTRTISVELSLTYDDFSMADTVRSYAAQDLTFNFGPSSESWTVSDVQFPEFPYELTPEDLVADSVASDPCNNLSFS